MDLSGLHASALAFSASVQERKEILWKEASQRMPSVASKESSVTRSPSLVRALRCRQLSEAAILVLADLQGYARQAELERPLCNTMAAMPDAAKLMLFSVVPPRFC